jgi:hypothetical protein
MNHSIQKKITAPILSGVSKMGNLIYPSRNESPVLISGSPRGGTTWIAEAVAETFSSKRMLWEPLQEGNIHKSHINFSKRPFVSDNNITGEQRIFFNKLLNAEFANAHTVRLRESYFNLFRLLSSDKLIIKFVRGNGVVGWLAKEYKIPKPVIIVRHPCAVISSQLKMGSWEDHPHIDSALYNINEKFIKYNDRNMELHKRLAVTWAADVTAAIYNKRNVHIVFYGDIVLNSGGEFREVFSDWGSEELFEKFKLISLKSSSTSHSWSDHSSVKSKIESWKSRLNQKVINDVLNIVDDLGVTLYGTDGLPRES